MSIIERIRNKIRSREYYLSSHAEEEMAEESLIAQTLRMRS